MRLAALLRDRRGAIVIEMAVIFPVVVMLMLGIMQFCFVLQASGAMRNAIGQGIRYAKVHPLTDPSDPDEVAALKSDVEGVARNALAGLDPAGITELEFSTATDGSGFETATITIQYVVTPMIPFAPVPPITLNQTRTGYLPT